MTAKHLIKHLELLPHPEGGYYKETYRSAGTVNKSCLSESFGGDRNYSTAIYYLLETGDFSAFHRIKSDECWHFYSGDELLVHVIDTIGSYECLCIGNDVENGAVFQAVVPAGAWFASEPAPGGKFSLVGCTVSPGFDFADFEMADRDNMLQEFPQHSELINRLCRQ